MCKIKGQHHQFGGVMSLSKIKQAIQDEKLLCPACKKPVKQFDKYVEMVSSIWEGAGDSAREESGSKVTLTCGNPGCDWKERTEYWANYIID